jgi:hypothetical protein
VSGPQRRGWSTPTTETDREREPLKLIVKLIVKRIVEDRRFFSL